MLCRCLQQANLSRKPADFGTYVQKHSIGRATYYRLTTCSFIGKTKNSLCVLQHPATLPAMKYVTGWRFVIVAWPERKIFCRYRTRQSAENDCARWARIYRRFADFNPEVVETEPLKPGDDPHILVPKETT